MYLYITMNDRNISGHGTDCNEDIKGITSNGFHVCLGSFACLILTAFQTKQLGETKVKMCLLSVSRLLSGVLSWGFNKIC